VLTEQLMISVLAIPAEGFVFGLYLGSTYLT